MYYLINLVISFMMAGNCRLINSLKGINILITEHLVVAEEPKAYQKVEQRCIAQQIDIL